MCELINSFNREKKLSNLGRCALDSFICSFQKLKYFRNQLPFLPHIYPEEYMYTYYK